MKHILTVGYVGKVFSTDDRGRAKGVGTHPDEPIRTIGPVIKAFRNEALNARIMLVDKSAQQGAPRRQREIASIWRNLSRKPSSWENLKSKLHRLQQLDSFLPVFRIAYPTVEIEVVSGEATIDIVSQDYEKLKQLKALFEKEPRTPAYGSLAPVSLATLAPALPSARRPKAGRQKSQPKA